MALQLDLSAEVHLGTGVRERRRSERGGCWNRSASAREWDSVPGSCVEISFGYMLVTEMSEKCQNFSLLTLRANPSPCLFVNSSALGYICYICCIFVKHVKYPWPEMRETARRSNGNELISEVEIVGTGRVGHIVSSEKTSAGSLCQHYKWYKLKGVKKKRADY